MILAFILIPSISLALVVASPFILMALIKADSRRYLRRLNGEFLTWMDGDRKTRFQPSMEVRFRYSEVWDRRDKEKA